MQEAIKLRAKFDANKSEGNFAIAQRMVAEGEALLVKNKHPDPYIVWPFLSPLFKNNCLAEMWRGSEESSC